MAKSKAMETIKKGFSYTTTLLIAIIGLVFLLVAYQSFKYPDQAPSLLGYQPFAVLSNSMSPHFETGDMVIIEKVDPEEINLNDVITFHQKGRVITHRVTDIEKLDGKVSYTTMGDNNNVVDEKAVTEDSVIGKQVFQVPKAGYVMNFMSSSIGLLSLIVLPLVGYVLLEMHGRMKKIRTNTDMPEYTTKE